jgi:integrase
MYLTMDELNMLRSWNPPTKSRQIALDLFLIQCYTGLSYSDLMATDFTKTENHNGNLILPRTTRVKTGTQYYITLLSPVIAILERYEYKLPRFTLQAYTRQLSIIEQETNIGKHITSHVGRHTFATTIALGSGIPIEVVSKMLGHTNIQTTQIYAKILPKQVEQGFEQIKKVVS